MSYTRLNPTDYARSKRGQLMNISFASLSALEPGCYSVGDSTNSIVGIPSTTYEKSTGWIYVFQATGRRIAALLVMGQGNAQDQPARVWVTSGIDADNWVALN